MNSNILQKAKELKDKFEFNKSLQYLDKINTQVQTPDYYRLKAQSYYQNSQLPIKTRFEKALELLEIENDDKPQETLRLKGAVYKQKYHYTRNIKELYKSIAYYERASQDMDEDKGYGAGNVVYLYYLLISTLDKALTNDIKKRYIQTSRDIALNTLKHLKSIDKNEWVYASMSALALSLGEFSKSKEYLLEYKKSCNREFDRKQFVTIEQMVKLFDILPFKKDESDLEEILMVYDNAKNMINSVRIGKIGLALSGGGFRASLFHIGVLKRLAQLDILRHIQVISTVSGGSIVGMYYYLELKKLLEKEENSLLSKADYIEMVSRIEQNFSNAIKSNLRMSAFLKSPLTPLTKKLGKLYQERLYNSISRVELMNELPIKPKIGGINRDDFQPNYYNFELKNSVPNLIINATLLNNGHNWQFTTEGMGENAYMTDMSIDNNPLYPFQPYTEEITIGDAVASSSAVPILFDPIELSIDTKEVKLSDGGLYDNLGLSSLIADNCSHIIVSDGSGQLKAEENPSTFRPDVIGRTTEVLMYRTRDGEYKMAKSLKELGVLDGLALFHMESKSDIDNKLQTKLSLIRTDLDAFHELESTALIYAGYKISSYGFDSLQKEDWSEFDLKQKESSDFEEFEKRFAEDREGVLKILDVSSRVLFKLFGIGSKSEGIDFKGMVKMVLNKFGGLVMLPFAWGYLKLLNKIYIKKGE